MATKDIYIYGIVPNFYGADQFRSLDKSGVYTISFQNISAIVSDSDNTHLDLLDTESLAYLLVHHQKTIEDLMGKESPMIIPMRLGTFAVNKRQVWKILEKGYHLIIDILKKIENVVEFDVVVTYTDFSEAIQEIANNTDVVTLKDSILKNGSEITGADQIQIGRLVKEKLDERKNAIASKIIDALSIFSCEARAHEMMDDQMILNTAYLINRNDKAQFEIMLDKLDKTFDGKLNFKMVGPLPCYSFYTLEVKEMNPEQVEQAKKELVLSEEISENEIRKAYLEKVKLFHPDKNSGEDHYYNFNRIKNAYHTMLDYSAAVRQSSNEEKFSLAKEQVIENLILVKLKE